MAGPMPNRQVLIEGAAGKIEVAESVATSESFLPRAAIAVIAHPHPLFGGTMDNKVVTTLARSLYDLNAAVVRFNFRGIGQSEGTHDEGRGETDDLLTVIEHARRTGIPYYYLGYHIAACAKMNYKVRFRPYELGDSKGGWQRFES